MKTAIIDFKPVFSKRDQGIFFKRALKRCKQVLNIEGKEILVYLLPIFLGKPSEKALSAFISYLKEEGIEAVLLSKTASLLPIAQRVSEKFLTFSGNHVINYKINEIQKKCATKKEISLAESTVIFFTNDSYLLKNYVLKIHKNVKRIIVITEKPEEFTKIISFFLEEYGLFIAVNPEHLPKGDFITIDLDYEKEKTDFSLKRSEILFKKELHLKKLEEYFDFNQVMIEFLINRWYGQVSEETIKQFFHDYLLKIAKIKNSD